jgi:hypothetical protein
VLHSFVPKDELFAQIIDAQNSSQRLSNEGIWSDQESLCTQWTQKEELVRAFPAISRFRPAFQDSANDLEFPAHRIPLTSGTIDRTSSLLEVTSCFPQLCGTGRLTDSGH